MSVLVAGAKTTAAQRKLAELTIRTLQPFAKTGRRLMGIGK